MKWVEHQTPTQGKSDSFIMVKKQLNPICHSISVRLWLGHYKSLTLVDLLLFFRLLYCCVSEVCFSKKKLGETQYMHCKVHYIHHISVLVSNFSWSSAAVYFFKNWILSFHQVWVIITNSIKHFFVFTLSPCVKQILFWNKIYWK